MNNQKFVRKLIVICFCVLFILLISMIIILHKEQENIDNSNEMLATPAKQDIENDVYDNNQYYTSVQQVLESYGCTYIREETQSSVSIYLEFGKNLFEPNGSNNRTYYESLINAVAKRLVKETFYLYDNEKGIKIYVTCDFKNNSISYKINNLSNYFDRVNEELYRNIETTEIATYQSMPISYNVLYKLVNNNMYIVDDLGESEGEDGKYKIYQNGTIKSRNFSGKVRNIVFLEGYEGNVFTGVKVGTPLTEVKELYPNVAFGSIEEGFLGYRTKDLYVFIYENEISAYGYSYYEQINFENILEEYLNTKDLYTFADKVTKLWTNYDEFEYDKEQKNLYITYPSIGIIINIQNNNSKGITIYNNYYLSDKIKNFIVEDKISLEPTVDILYMSEINRINNT